MVTQYKRISVQNTQREVFLHSTYNYHMEFTITKYIDDLKYISIMAAKWTEVMTAELQMQEIYKK